MTIELSEQRYADVVVLTVGGRVDQETAAEFETVLLDLVNAPKESHCGVVVDFDAVDYISSVGLRALVVARKRCQQTGCEIVVSGVTGFVEEVFEIARFGRIFDIRDSLRDAIGAVSAAAAEAYDRAT